MKKSILAIVSIPFLSGAEYAFYDLIRKDRENDYWVLMPDIPQAVDHFLKTLPRDRIILNNNFRFQGFSSAKGIWKLFKLIGKLISVFLGKIFVKSILRKHKFDILLGHNTSDILFFPRVKMRTVLIVQDNLLENKRLSSMIRVFSRNVECFIANTQLVRNGLLNCGIISEKITIIYNGLESNRKKPRDRKDSSKPSVLIWIGSCEPRKNIIEFLQIVEMLSEKSMPIRAICVFRKADDTNYSLMDQALKGMKYRDRITLYENLKKDEVIKLYDEADISVCTSLNDPLPIVIPEAYNEGIPAIGRNISGVNEIIEHGSNGFLYDSVDQIPKLFNILIENYTTFSKNAIQTLDSKYSLDCRVEQMREIYEGNQCRG